MENKDRHDMWNNMQRWKGQTVADSDTHPDWSQIRKLIATLDEALHEQPSLFGQTAHAITHTLAAMASDNVEIRNSTKDEVAQWAFNASRVAMQVQKQRDELCDELAKYQGGAK